MTKYPTESAYRKQRLTDSQCSFFVLGRGQEAAGHSALAVREQREMGTLALFTSCSVWAAYQPWVGAACVLGGSSVWAASRGMVPPVFWKGLPFSGKSFRHTHRGVVTLNPGKLTFKIHYPRDILRSVGCGETTRCSGLWTSVDICVEIRSRSAPDSWEVWSQLVRQDEGSPHLQVYCGEVFR